MVLSIVDDANNESEDYDKEDISLVVSKKIGGDEIIDDDSSICDNQIVKKGKNSVRLSDLLGFNNYEGEIVEEEGNRKSSSFSTSSSTSTNVKELPTSSTSTTELPPKTSNTPKTTSTSATKTSKSTSTSTNNEGVIEVTEITKIITETVITSIIFYGSEIDPTETLLMGEEEEIKFIEGEVIGKDDQNSYLNKKAKKKGNGKAKILIPTQIKISRKEEKEKKPFPLQQFKSGDVGAPPGFTP